MHKKADREGLQSDIARGTARETAMREILAVIDASRDDANPVFDVILANAERLCRAAGSGLQLVDDTRTTLTLVRNGPGVNSETFPEGTVFDLKDPLVMCEAVRKGAVQHVPDMRDTELYRAGHEGRRKLVDAEGVRAHLSVPLLRNGVALGNMTLSRMEPDPFSPEDIELVEDFAAHAVVAIENMHQFREVQTRLERERATAEILDAISRCRDDETPVFEAVLRNARVLCNASTSALLLGRPQDAHLQLVAVNDADLDQQTSDEHMERARAQPIDNDPEMHISAEAVHRGAIVHVADLRDTEWYARGAHSVRFIADEVGQRTTLCVPLLDEGVAVGAINLHRRTVAPFSDDEIALVRSFATQAVVAIQNARQFREVQTRLEREAASREILQVISASRSDPAPVFDVILKHASDLSGAPQANLCLVNEARSHWQLVAHFGDGLRHLTVGDPPRSLERNLVPAVSIRESRIVHIEDLTQTEEYQTGDPGRTAMVDKEGMRTILGVPLRRNSETIGCITLFRREVKPFTSDEIALVEIFAAQAVIAIENVRQFQEVQTRLERETASREILGVVSQSRDDDTPVFDVILANAARLCNAPLADLDLVDDDERHLREVATFGSATRAVPSDEWVWSMDSDYNHVKAVRSGTVLQVDDIRETEKYRSGDPMTRATVDEEGMRTLLVVPLMASGRGIGCIILFRQEVKPFSQDEIALVETFAAQAVIAIENVRQFQEVQNRLERERASAEVLDVISRSRADEQPVFDTILRNAAQICGSPSAGLAICNEDRTHLTMVGHWGHVLSHLAVGETQWPLDSNLALAIAVNERRVEHVVDLYDTELYRAGDPSRVESVDKEGIRTFLAVPLIAGDVAIGGIALYRQEVAPFSDDEIALVETFASQAVIAIENVRQFREVQDRLQRETASGKILRVISQSRDDDQPVFDVILSNAARLCQADQATLQLVDDKRTRFRLAAGWGLDHTAFPIGQDWPLEGTQPVPTAIRTGQSINITDLKETDSYREGDPVVSRIVDVEGVRSRLIVPLMHDDLAIGTMSISRRNIQPFSQTDIQLIETFAAQAVIAIENVRQFKALEALNAELGDRVEEQVGEIERMGKLKRFLPAAVADTVVSSGSDEMLRSHRALLGVLFCDIRGFTAFCETAEPEETIEVLQTYHQEMGKLINDHGAGVDHRMGDGIMVLFNDPLPCEDPAGDAVRLALAMRTRMEELCRAWKRMGHRLGFGVGVSLGYATVGMVGYEGRSDYTASGTAVNVAARLCDMAEDGEILLSTRASIAVEDDYPSTSAGEVALKGIREPVEVFRLNDISPE